MATKKEKQAAKSEKNDKLKAELGSGVEAWKEYETKAKKYIPSTLETQGQTTFTPTGSLVVDTLTTRGGIPRGCLTEIAGEPGGGKTTLAIKICKNIIANGGTAAYVNAEQALDVDYAMALGLDILNDPKFIIWMFRIEKAWLVN